MKPQRHWMSDKCWKSMERSALPLQALVDADRYEFQCNLLRSVISIKEMSHLWCMLHVYELSLWSICLCLCLTVLGNVLENDEEFLRSLAKPTSRSTFSGTSRTVSEEGSMSAPSSPSRFKRDGKRLDDFEIPAPFDADESSLPHSGPKRPSSSPAKLSRPVAPLPPLPPPIVSPVTSCDIKSKSRSSSRSARFDFAISDSGLDSIDSSPRSSQRDSLRKHLSFRSNPLDRPSRSTSNDSQTSDYYS